MKVQLFDVCKVIWRKSYVSLDNEELIVVVLNTANDAAALKCLVLFEGVNLSPSRSFFYTTSSKIESYEVIDNMSLLNLSYYEQMNEDDINNLHQYLKEFHADLFI